MRLSIAVILSLSASIAPAQVTIGSLEGVVTDPSGRPVPHASIRATDTLRSAVHASATDGSGFYRITELSPSVYSVTVSADGFDKATVDEAMVSVDSSVRVDFRLRITG